MGSALITGGGADGRYSIRLDYGSANRTAVLAALSQLLARLDTDIAAVQARIADASAEVAQRKARLDQAITDQVAAIQSGGAIDQASFNEVRRYYAQAQAAVSPLQRHLDALKFDRSATLRDIAKWTAFNPISERQAWCVDFTEGGSGSVATLDINGESDLVVLAPGCRAWQASDGVMTAREVQAPHQVFLNAALLPGWQRHRPTFRWGTLTGVDYDANTADVELATATSSARSLPINAASSLTGVPVTYMTCNADAFEVGDRVVVQFVGSDWAQPRVIGFLDNPRPCVAYGARFWEERFVGDAYDTGAESQVLPSVQISLQDPLAPGATVEPVTARSPAGIHAFVGWRVSTQTHNPTTGVWTASTTWAQSLTLSLGRMGTRRVVATATYLNPGAEAVDWRYASVQWSYGPELVEVEPGVFRYFGAVTGNWEAFVVQRDAVTATGAESSGTFQLDFGDGPATSPWEYLNRLPDVSVPAVLGSYTVAASHVPTANSWTVTMTYHGDIPGRDYDHWYIPTALDRLMP